MATAPATQAATQLSSSDNTAGDEPIVSFRDVDIVFGDRPASALPLIDAGESRSDIATATNQIVGVMGASLDIAEGEIVVLMGLSGSGKSTLLRAVNGLNPVTRGEVLVRDDNGERVSVGTCTPERLRQLRTGRIAMVFQQFALLPWRSVEDNVAFGLELAGMPRPERMARVAERLKLVNLSDWALKPVHALSGGMQQRVGLARAFATDAPILLMDEPYSALDPLIRANLQDELLDLQRGLKRTIIFVSHDLDEAMKIGNRIAIMEGGRIIQIGTPQQIVLTPATTYVSDFVAHMNPLNVLRALEVMRPLASLEENDGRRVLSVDRAITCGPDGAIHVAGEIIAPCEIPADGPVPSPLTGHTGPTVLCAEATLPLKRLTQARLQAAGPIIVRSNGECVGIIEDADLFRSLTR